MEDGYNLVELTLEDLNETENQWSNKISNHIHEDLYQIAYGSYDRLLTWVRKSLNAGSCSNCGFFVVKKATDNQMLAIVEMTDARQAKDPSFKFLNFFLAPELNLEFKDIETSADLKSTVEVLLVALIKSASHALMNGSKFKMYGRTDEILAVFETAIALNESASGMFNVYKQSKWLIIEPK